MNAAKRIPTHPGRILREELDARAMSASALAKALGVDAPRINEIVNCRRSVTPDTALRLARYFEGSPKFWLTMQMNHDLGKAEAELGARIKNEVRAAA